MSTYYMKLSPNGSPTYVDSQGNSIPASAITQQQMVQGPGDSGMVAQQVPNPDMQLGGYVTSNGQIAPPTLDGYNQAWSSVGGQGQASIATGGGWLDNFLANVAPGLMLGAGMAGVGAVGMGALSLGGAVPAGSDAMGALGAGGGDALSAGSDTALMNGGLGGITASSGTYTAPTAVDGYTAGNPSIFDGVQFNGGNPLDEMANSGLSSGTPINAANGAAYDPTMSGLAGNNNLPAITAANSGSSGLSGLLQQMGMSPQMANLLGGTAPLAASALGSGSGSNNGLLGQALGYLNGQSTANNLQSNAQAAMAAADPFASQRPFWQQQATSMMTDPNYFSNNALLQGANANSMSDMQRQMASQGYNLNPNVASSIAQRLQNNEMSYAQPLMNSVLGAAGANIQPYGAGQVALQGLNTATAANSVNNSTSGQNLLNTGATDLSGLISALGLNSPTQTSTTSGTLATNSPTSTPNTLSAMFSGAGGVGNNFNAPQQSSIAGLS